MLIKKIIKAFKETVNITLRVSPFNFFEGLFLFLALLKYNVDFCLFLVQRSRLVAQEGKNKLLIEIIRVILMKGRDLFMELSRSQLFALEHITKYARNHKHEAKATISNISDKILENAVANLKSHARIGLHFHPDRLDSTMKSVAEALLEQGIYKSQFETFLSNWLC